MNPHFTQGGHNIHSMHLTLFSATAMKKCVLQGITDSDLRGSMNLLTKYLEMPESMQQVILIASRAYPAIIADSTALSVTYRHSSI